MSRSLDLLLLHQTHCLGSLPVYFWIFKALVRQKSTVGSDGATRWRSCFLQLTSSRAMSRRQGLVQKRGMQGMKGPMLQKIHLMQQLWNTRAFSRLECKELGPKPFGWLSPHGQVEAVLGDCVDGAMARMAEGNGHTKWARGNRWATKAPKVQKQHFYTFYNNEHCHLENTNTYKNNKTLKRSETFLLSNN